MIKTYSILIFTILSVFTIYAESENLTIPELSQSLRGTDKDVKFALKYLLKHGESLIKPKQGDDIDQTLLGVREYLEEIKDDVIRLCEERPIKNQYLISSLLGLTFPDSNTKVALEILYREGNDEVRSRVIYSLASLGSKNSGEKDFILKAIKDSIDAKTFQAAVKVASSWKMDDAVDEIFIKLNDKRPAIKKIAIQSLSSFKNSDDRILSKLKGMEISEENQEIKNSLKKSILKIEKNENAQ